jgi:uncharacterized phage protein (TIGR02220 family)
MGNGKGTYYFSHDYHARNDEKVEALLLVHGWEGYGVYWMLVERMYEAPECALRTDKIAQIARASMLEADKLESIVQTCIDEDLFSSADGWFWSNSAKDRKADFEAIKEKYSLAGKKGMAVRWKKPIPKEVSKHEKKDSPSPPPDNAEEIRKKQREENALIKKVFNYFCAQSGRALKLDDARRNIIKRRITKEGRTWEEFEKVIDNFCADGWEGRDDYVDIVYCMGTIRGHNKFDHWLHKKPRGSGIMGDSERKDRE